MTLSDITHECESVCGCVWWWQRAESPSEKGERRAPQGYAKPTAFSWPACALPRWTRASGRGMESASQEEARFLGPGGGEYRNPGLPLLSLRGPGKAGPSEGGAPLVGHNSLPNHLWLHRHRFSFQGGLYGSSALVWDFPPALGRADPLSASDPSLPLKPSLPLPLLLCPPPTDLEKRHLSP